MKMYMTLVPIKDIRGFKVEHSNQVPILQPEGDDSIMTLVEVQNAKRIGEMVLSAVRELQKLGIADLSKISIVATFEQ